MITFHNGPAHGVHLFLRRAPFFLRVTHKMEGGKDVWDALDQPLDAAAADETLHVYTAAAKRFGFAFFDGRGKNGRREGWSSVVGDYEYWLRQPSDAIMRDNERWAQWCDDQRNFKDADAKFEAWQEANKVDQSAQ